MQCRILSSSLVDNNEHTEAFELVNCEEDGINEVVDETVDELVDKLFGDKEAFGVDPVLFLFLVGSPSARTHDRFIPAFSQAWNRQNWQFLRVFKVITQCPPLLHL